MTTERGQAEACPYYFFPLESTVIGFQHTAPAEPFIWQKRPVLPSTTEKCSGPVEYL